MLKYELYIRKDDNHQLKILNYLLYLEGVVCKSLVLLSPTTALAH